MHAGSLSPVRAASPRPSRQGEDISSGNTRRCLISLGILPSVSGTYESLAQSAARIGGFGSFGAVVGAIAAAIFNDISTRGASYGEWAAYAAAMAGTFSIAFEVGRAI